MIPTRNQCYQLLRQYDFPEKKYKHTELVAKVAVFLAKKVREVGKISVDTELLEISAILHDLDKGIPDAGKLHPQIGVKILRHEGFVEVADVVAKHSLPSILNVESCPKTWEEKLLYLSDKMVQNEIITVDERFNRWRDEGVPKQNQMLNETYSLVKKLEKEVFELIGMEPGEVKRELEIHPSL